MAERWVPGEAAPMGGRAATASLQHDSPTAGHHNAQAPHNAWSDGVSNLNFERLSTANKPGYSSSPGTKFLSITITPSQPSTQPDSASDKSISAFCEECFYCPECSDNSDCQSCFDQESCADCLKVCKECDQMDPTLPFPSVTEKPCLDCGDWTAFFADTENSRLDFGGGQPLNPSDVANQRDAQESTFDQYIEFPEPNASETQDSVAASAASLASLPIDGPDSPTAELFDDMFTDTRRVDQQTIDPGKVEFPGVLTGFGAQFDDVFTPYGGNAFLSTSPTSYFDLLRYYYGKFDESADASFHQSSTPVANSANNLESAYMMPAMSPKHQRPIHTIEAPAVPGGQSPNAIYDAGTGTRLNQQHDVDTALYPAATSTALLAHPSTLYGHVQPSPITQVAPVYAPAPSSSGVPFSAPGSIVYQMPSNWTASAEQAHAMAYHAPNPTNAALAGPSCLPPPSSTVEDPYGRSMSTQGPTRRSPHRRAEKDKRFSCNYDQPSGGKCSFTCPTRSQLKNHEDAIHRGVKPYTCGVLVDAIDKAQDEDGNTYQPGDPRAHTCTVAQVDASGISKHRRIHYDNKEKCFYCAKTFSKTDQRKRHCRRNMGGRAACPGLRDRPANRWVDAGTSVYHEGKPDEQRHQTQLPDDFETRVAQARR